VCTQEAGRSLCRRVRQLRGPQVRTCAFGPGMNNHRGPDRYVRRNVSRAIFMKALSDSQLEPKLDAAGQPVKVKGKLVMIDKPKAMVDDMVRRRSPGAPTPTSSSCYHGPKITEHAHRVAFFVDKILRGVKPEDLPIEQPTAYEVVVNLKTAKALRITLPPSLLIQADQITP